MDPSLIEYLDRRFAETRQELRELRLETSERFEEMREETSRRFEEMRGETSAGFGVGSSSPRVYPIAEAK